MTDALPAPGIDPRGAALRVGGIVLCGGRSTRMGRPKLALPFGPETMLARTVRILRESVAPIVVVAAPDQEVPVLSEDVRIVRDALETTGSGPLAGLAVGLAALAGEVDAAFVAACDMPLLRPAFVERLVARLGRHDLAVCRAGGYHHPLAAVYRVGLAARVRRLLESGRLRPLFLIEESDSVVLDEFDVRDVDPDLQSLRNANTPEEYAAVLELAGLSVWGASNEERGG